MPDRCIAAWLHGRASNTHDAYSRDVRAFLAFASDRYRSEKPVEDLRLEDVQAWDRWMEEQGLTASTRRRKMAAARSFFRFLGEQGRVAKNPAAGVRPPRSRETLTERILTEDDVRRIIIHEPDERKRLLLKLLYAGALRASELVGLRKADVVYRSPVQDRGRGRVQLTVFGKGSKTRQVLIEGSAAGELLQLRDTLTDADERIFALSRHGLYRVVKAAAARAGLPAASTHWMRHAHATHALWAGADIKLVQTTLGHASISTTAQYLHVRPETSSSSYLSL